MASTIEILRTKDALDLWSLLPAAAGVEEAAEPSEGLFLEKIRFFLGALRSGLNGAVRGE